MFMRCSSYFPSQLFIFKNLPARWKLMRNTFFGVLFFQADVKRNDVKREGGSTKVFTPIELRISLSYKYSLRNSKDDNEMRFCIYPDVMFHFLLQCIYVK